MGFLLSYPQEEKKVTTMRLGDECSTAAIDGFLGITPLFLRYHHSPPIFFAPIWNTNES